MFFLRKWFRLRRRRKRALRLGFEFKRAAGFEPPNQIEVQGHSLSLYFPNEVGTTNDFLSIFLDDDYRLDRQKWAVSTVLDIGANLGFFSIAARNAFPEAKIHAYEPNQSLQEYLNPHASQASFNINYEAVGLDDGCVTLDVRGETNQTRSQSDESGDVPQIAFRKAVDRLGGRVDFAKIDCEGAEWEFLEDTDTWKNVHFLAMEYHLWPGNKYHHDADVALRKLGFQILQQIPIDNYGLIYAMRL
ncbi:MAG: FkbM family methyltransferase [Opitutae bacterium]|nr:FkbM family methyltransferase [Opitutae bacterium]MBT6461233.1 FkbM family methyltransferase [Opitutae bacterium]